MLVDPMTKRTAGGKVGTFPGILGATRDRSLSLCAPLEAACVHGGELDPDAPRDSGVRVYVWWRCRSCGQVIVTESFTYEAWRRAAGRPLKDPR